MMLSACGVANAPPTPLAEVLSDSARFNDKPVRVCGYLRDAVETCALWEHQGTPASDPPGAFFPPEGRIWISTPDESCAPGNPLPMAGETTITMWVIVSGTYQTGDHYGHLGAFTQQIAATSIEPAAYKCGAEGGT